MPRARRLANLFAACLAAGVTATAVAMALPSGSSGESLRLADRSPLTVAGRGFGARERVRVRLDVAGDRAVRRVRASRAGSIRVAFTGITFDRCLGLDVLATGREGGRARLKRAPKACPPPLRPREERRVGSGGPAPAPATGSSCGPPVDDQAVQQAAGKGAPAECPPN
jgi:hypothetical protein